MTLRMSEKKSLTREQCLRYHNCGKKDKQKLLDEFCLVTGYNRKYAVRVLNAAYNTTPEIKAKLLLLSPATIDRLLKADKAVLRGKGISGTRAGEAALLRHIPVRTHGLRHVHRLVVIVHAFLLQGANNPLHKNRS